MLRSAANLRRLLGTVSLLSIALATAPGSATAVPFAPQDLNLLSRSLPDASGTIEGIVRIEPLGTATLVYQAVDPIEPVLIYDLHRDLLVFREKNVTLGLDADTI